MNFEGRRTREGQVATANFPIDPFRSGDFSALQNGYIANGRFVYADHHLRPRHRRSVPEQRHSGNADSSRRTQCADTYVPHAQFVQSDIQDFTARASVPTPTEREYLLCAGRSQHQRQRIESSRVSRGTDRISRAAISIQLACVRETPR